MTQPEPELAVNNEHGYTIRRIKKDEMANDITSDIVIHHYSVHKTNMPDYVTLMTPLSLKVLATKVMVTKWAAENDSNFFKDITTPKDVPEYNGYNTRHAREESHTVGKKIVAVYCPLIDLVPSDADTILKTMVEAELRAKATG